ncbi:hypothetical protein [Sulfurivirga sp.]|uniref:zinc ribbon-containing protein n=1 Tax=Sulfurivirga sp. TaxID=2614236 RepID=UPI0025D6651E|nr:hypothetical protein [Sulfurivirga sp.]
MLNAQQKQAYARLLKQAQQHAKQAEKDIMAALREAIDAASIRQEEFKELTEAELDRVKQALKEDLDAVARYFEEVGEGLEEILTLDAAWLEEKFLEISEKLADPARLELLKLRMMAALNERERN